MIATIIRENIEALDKYVELAEADLDTSRDGRLVGNEHVSLGSQITPLTIRLLEGHMFGNNLAFHGFQRSYQDHSR